MPGDENKNKPFKIALLRVMDMIDSGKSLNRLTTLERIAASLIADAEHNDEDIRVTERDRLINRLDGKPHQQIQADMDADVNAVTTFTWKSSTPNVT